MPNTGHKWTPAEEADAVTLEWEEFHANYPDISREAWRQRHGRAVRSGKVEAQAITAEHNLERAIANTIKLARSVIRLRHSIEADDELAATIPMIRARLTAQAQDGQVEGLSYDELRALIFGK